MARARKLKIQNFRFQTKANSKADRGPQVQRLEFRLGLARILPYRRAWPATRYSHGSRDDWPESQTQVPQPRRGLWPQARRLSGTTPRVRRYFCAYRFCLNDAQKFARCHHLNPKFLDIPEVLYIMRHDGVRAHGHGELKDELVNQGAGSGHPELRCMPRRAGKDL